MNETLTARPGATEAEAIALNESGILCELIDGRIVRKEMGSPESFLAIDLAFHLKTFLATHPIGFVYGADALVRFSADTLLEPDVTFTARARCPDGKLPREQVATVIPNLAVEVLSPSKRAGEMARKLSIYFDAGVELVWLIDPATKSARVYTSPDDVVMLTETDSVTGGEVLPGFALPLATLFAEFA